MTSDLKFSVNLFMGSNIPKIKKMVENVNQLLVQLDSVLDKPFRDDPKFACGDCLENMRDVLEEINDDICHYGRIVIAKSLAWHNYPGRIIHDEGDAIDIDEWRREAFICGWMDSSYEKDS